LLAAALLDDLFEHPAGRWCRLKSILNNPDDFLLPVVGRPATSVAVGGRKFSNEPIH
jgi:hypothetical protein